MQIKTIYTLLTVLMVSFMFFILASCSDGVHSVYWTIIHAQKEEDHSLNNNLSILAMTDDGSVYYIATGGRIYRQEMTLADNVWSKTNFPANAYFCTALRCFGTRLYAGFLREGASPELYSCANPNTNSPTWTPVTDAENDINGKQIIKIMEVNSQLFVSLQEPGSPFKYSLYYFDGIDNFIPVTGLVSKDDPIIDVIRDAAEYWAISGTNMYRGNLGGMVLLSGDDDPSGEDYSGLFYSATWGNIYASTEEGKVYMYNGSTWTSNGSAVESTGDIVYFTGISEINENIIVGTAGYGFFEMKGGAITELKRLDNDSLVSSDLYTSHVLSFYITPPDDLVFFCTAGDGLYHNTYSGDPAVWSLDWVRE
ncbi:MAG: hypothetical protein JXJ04_13000 [Spirochaetales bacterium]|nr:hypothetical protein [Spirochaetales bacterium]